MQKYLEKLVDQAEVIFWDFDGVIKDSVEVKSIAFEKLFSDYDQILQTGLENITKKMAGYQDLKRFLCIFLGLMK